MSPEKITLQVPRHRIGGIFSRWSFLSKELTAFSHLLFSPRISALDILQDSEYLSVSTSNISSDYNTKIYYSLNKKCIKGTLM